MNRPVVHLRIWGVDRVVPALGRMASGRIQLRATPGLRFAKLLGTGSGSTFTPRDADPHHWALLSVHDDTAAADAFGLHPAVRGWDTSACERLVVRLDPLASRGRWSGREPFGRDPRLDAASYDGPVAAITRARLRAGGMLSFWQAVPPVVADLRSAAGLRLAVGIGEAPIGLQGTFSLWDSGRQLIDFAYRSTAHQQVVEQTAGRRWYAEELFARFAVLDVSGQLNGVRP